MVSPRVPSRPVPRSTRDGRVERGERNRAQIVDAIIALIRAGHRYPTADQVAREAAVGVRTVFRHFDDMEGLYAAVNERIGEEVRPILEGCRFEGDTRERIRELVSCRARIYDKVAPMRRRASSREARSNAVQQGIAELNHHLRRQLERALAPELASADPDLVETLDAWLSFEAWDRLRTTQRLGRSRVETILETTLAAILAAETMERTP